MTVYPASQGDVKPHKVETADLQELKRKPNAETARKEEKKRKIEEGTSATGRTVTEDHHSSPISGVTKHAGHPSACSTKPAPPPVLPPALPPTARPIADVLFIKRKKASLVP